jgi:hypothetical protein
MKNIGKRYEKNREVEYKGTKRMEKDKINEKLKMKLRL